MQIHSIKRPQSNTRSHRVGRGGKRGTYSGRGMKGQKARAGARIRPAFRDVWARVPKLRGVQRKGRTARSQRLVAAISLARIERAYTAQESVSPRTLVEKKLIRRVNGRVPQVKILASGTFTKPLRFEQCLFSEKARKAVNAADGIFV